MSTKPTILYFDLEVAPKTQRVLEYGALLSGNTYRGAAKEKFERFSKDAMAVCGHNIIHHDLPILKKQSIAPSFLSKPTIDTLYLSALLFPKKPYHHLVKDYYLNGTEMNNPVADARLAKQLLADSAAAFHQLPTEQQIIYSHLLSSERGFDGLFGYVIPRMKKRVSKVKELERYIHQQYKGLICADTKLVRLIDKEPIPLAFALSIIGVANTDSLLPNWIKHQFPKTLGIINELRVACDGNKGCPYCDKLSPLKGLKRFFGFDAFRSFSGDEGMPLQEQVVEAALARQSFVAIFPTGGGKSLTFQLPALMKGAANHSLTVIISPLQSLMKDQVDVLRERHDLTEAVTINGLLSPLERGEAIERVENGGANLLYISPESLRSNTIVGLLKRRVINRFVIDEAHCFSSWGQDFRVDYLYIGKFIKKLQEAKQLLVPIPVSCFTATAKPAVVEDIQSYFQEQLDLSLKIYQTNAKRKNLSYFVIATANKEAKYEKLKDLLQSEEGAKIVYVSRVKTSEELVYQLSQDGIMAKAYNGQMEREEKIDIQNNFMSEEATLDTIVATSAFGMGVDKDNVKMVIHYTISDSLENYLQESGRAGRKEDLAAKCYVLYNQEDLDKHFNLLNLSKLSHKEVYQIWQGIKHFKRKKFVKSALEIAKRAGWDTEMRDLETKVKVAIAALEESGYVIREENIPSIFAQSILVKSVEAAQQKMQQGIHHFLDATQLKNAKRIFSALISRAKAKQDTRVDLLADTLAIEKHEVTTILNIFKEIGLLSNNKDLSVYFFTVQGKRNSITVFNRVSSIEKELFKIIFPTAHRTRKDIYLREINEQLSEHGVAANLPLIKEVLNYWAQVGYLKKERIDKTNNQYRLNLSLPHEQLREQIQQRLEIGSYCLTILKQRFLPAAKEGVAGKRLLSFSVLDLKLATEEFTDKPHPIRFYEFILLYFHNLKIIELKDGLMIYYNPMKITRAVDDQRKRYTQEDYAQLAQFYERKTEQIHIVGEYAKKQLVNNIAAMEFVEDYFSLPYDHFLGKYFKGKKSIIRRTITEEKFKQIFSELSTEQLGVVKDKSANILVAAGPGSGKTRVLVHKVASLLLMEDVKPEQFLMLTFTRPAALEFKQRLIDIVGPVAYHIDIFTYHGFAFQLAGRVGNLEKSKNILGTVKTAIATEEIPLDRIKNKSVVVVDEYQDVSQKEYDFLMALVDCAENIRVIAAGDDDQNIYEFRGANVAYMRGFIQRQDAQTHFLTLNFRADKNLLQFTNRFLTTHLSSERMKHNIQLIPHQQKNGRIEIIHYTSTTLFLPLVAHITQQSLVGTTAILTYKNEEAVLLTTLLKQKGIRASLLSDKQGFSLRSILELRTFTHLIQANIQDELGLITKENWEKSKAKLQEWYAQSKNLDLVDRVLHAFESIHPKKFKSTWTTFLKESRREDFYHPEQGTIFVATMHKSKGKEFDNVFLLLNNYPLQKEEKKRVLYVAMTRAKHLLSIHTNSIDFETANIEGLSYQQDTRPYSLPNTLVLECGMRDVHLSYFKIPAIIKNVKAIRSGVALLAHPSYPAIFQTLDTQRNVTKFSAAFLSKLNGYFRQGYQLQAVHAKYIVVWYDEEVGKEFRVVLAELVLG